MQKKGLHCRRRVALASCAYSFQSSKQTLKGVFCPRRHTLSGSSPDWLRELLLPLSRVPPLVHGHWTGAKAFSCVLTTPESRLLFENNVRKTRCDHFYQYSNHDGKPAEMLSWSVPGAVVFGQKVFLAKTDRGNVFVSKNYVYKCCGSPLESSWRSISVLHFSGKLASEIRII